MRRLLLSAVAMFVALASLSAQTFDNYFTDNTLRIDYTFAGNSSEQYIALRELSSTEGGDIWLPWLVLE